ALACRLRSSTAAAFTVCVFGWMIFEPRALPRPHVFSFFALAACVWLVERARQTGSARSLGWLPVLIAAWANVHVECVFGIGFVAWTVLAFVVIAVRWRRVGLSELAPLAVFALLGLRYLRLTPMLFLASAPLVARCLDELRQVRIEGRLRQGFGAQSRLMALT